MSDHMMLQMLLHIAKQLNAMRHKPPMGQEDHLRKELAELSAWVNKQPVPNVDLSIDRLDLTTRSYNCLHNAGIFTVGDLTEQSVHDLLRLEGMGRTSVRDIIEALGAIGLTLQGNNWPWHESHFSMKERGTDG